MENKLHRKLFDIQCELKAINKEKKGGHYGNRYFDINLLISEIKPLFIKHNIIVLQPLTSLDGKLAIETMISDAETGETMRFVSPVTHSEDPQKMGGVITYFRRYALTSLFLIEGEEDHDLQGSQPKVEDPLAECPACKDAKVKGYLTCYAHRKPKETKIYEETKSYADLPE